MRFFAPLVVLLAASVPVRAAVVVVANYTAEAVTFQIAEPEAKTRAHTIASNHVAPVYVTGPADITFRAKEGDTKLRLDVYNAYMFLPDKVAGVRLEGVELPGEALARDTRAELNPVPRDPPVKVPVTLYVDDCDPRADKLWQKEVLTRFDEASAVIEKASGIRLEFAGYGTWKSAPGAANTSELLKGFEDAVKVKAGSLAVGYSSRNVDPKADPAFGATRGIEGRHVLLREWVPKAEGQRTEVMVHFLATSLGAVGTPDPGSAMRPKLDDEYMLRAGSVLRLDPLNALALNLWADERRNAPDVDLVTLSPVNRHRLARLYKAMLKAAPGDALAITYLNGLDRDVAKNPDPMPKQPERPSVEVSKRDELVRKIVKVVTERAKLNAGKGNSVLTGDSLTAAYLKAAAEEALKNAGPEMVSAFLIALGLALDDTDALLNDAMTTEAVRAIETSEEKAERLAVLGNPTFGGRRDVCRRFFIGCATGDILPQAAEQVAVGRAIFDLHGPTGLCLPAVAAEFAGIAFARSVFYDAEILRDVANVFDAKSYLPPLAGLRNGFTAAKFEELFGDANDARFLAALADIRNRLKAMNAYKYAPEE